MKYVCTEDIENLAAQGKKELILDENTVLMDLARDMANQLGITVVGGSRSIPVMSAPPAAPPSPAKAASPAAPVPSTRDAAPKLGLKPKGCQHGPLSVPARQEHSINSQDSGGMVDQMVELVRQSTGKRPGN